MPDPQTQEVPILHGPGRQVLPEPAGPRLQGGGPDDQAGDRCHRIQGGGTKLYLSPVVDLYNDEVVAYSISRSPNMKMVLEMLAGLEGRLDGEGAPLLHSDMGWQYQMPAYRLALERMGIVQSMSRKGNCLDNAKAESFFSMVKTELYYDWEGDDPDVFERDLGKYIDWYNNVRIKKRLDGSSPVEYRLGRAD